LLLLLNHTTKKFWINFYSNGYNRHAGARGDEIADKLARDSSVQTFVGPEPSLGFSRQNVRKTIKGWMDTQHLVRWPGLSGNQRQTRELISVPRAATKTRHLSFNTAHSRVVIGLLTGHNTLRRHLHLMGLTNSPLHWTCGVEDETSDQIP
jgi:hypothetical protein